MLIWLLSQNHIKVLSIKSNKLPLVPEQIGTFITISMSSTDIYVLEIYINYLFMKYLLSFCVPSLFPTSVLPRAIKRKRLISAPQVRSPTTFASSQISNNLTMKQSLPYQQYQQQQQQQQQQHQQLQQHQQHNHKTQSSIEKGTIVNSFSDCSIELTDGDVENLSHPNSIGGQFKVYSKSTRSYWNQLY